MSLYFLYFDKTMLADTWENKLLYLKNDLRVRRQLWISRQNIFWSFKIGILNEK